MLLDDSVCHFERSSHLRLVGVGVLGACEAFFDPINHGVPGFLDRLVVGLDGCWIVGQDADDCLLHLESLAFARHCVHRRIPAEIRL